jgi:2'-5' RNA ligase
VRETLAAVPAGDGWRRVPEQSLHVTLAFLGQLDAAEPVIEAVRPALRPLSPLTLGGVVLLPPRRPRVMAVRLEGEMSALQSAVSGSLAAAGLYAPEKRPFLAHVTIGRARRRPSTDVPAVPALGFMAPSVSVYESQLSPKGAEYTALATFPILTAAQDADVIRAARLAALADSPRSFGRTLEEETARPAAWWEDLARRSAAGVTDRVFLAGGGAAGMAGGHLEGEDVVLWGMWVAPDARGKGVGRALMDAVVAWARSIGAPRVVLLVKDGVPFAAELYASAGFEPTHREGDETHFALRLT